MLGAGGWGARGILRSAAGLLALTLAACYEDAVAPPDTILVPAEVRWLEWPGQVSGALGESLRVVVYAPCGVPRIGVTADGERITVAAQEELGPERICLGINNGIYDTVLPLPALYPAEPPSLIHPMPFLVTAPVRNYITGALEAASLGVLELTFQSPFQAVRHAAGRARLSSDTGCAWIRPDGPVGETHLMLNPPAAISEGEQARSALVGGTYLPAEPPQCGHTTGIQLRYAQVDLLP